VFSTERFGIGEEASNVNVSKTDDPMDELLGFGGAFIFDDIDFRRYVIDSLELGLRNYSPVLKK
jgi:hypothetical protein